jgi:hypothetical protein
MTMKISPNDVSNREILTTLKKLAQGVDDIKESQVEILEVVQETSSQTDARIMLLESRMTRVESRMVTKDYLDDKLADQYSKIVAHTDKRIEKALS